ncbi:MAG: peptidase M48 [Calditrichaeota bacterium]|nr:MAG: peptidase M48 [Calditrichota bacterium]
MLMSEAEEISLGKEADAQIVQQYGLYEDPRLQEYITRIGQRMAKLSHRPHLQYQFKIMDSPIINAFAIPGGYVYVTRGILAYLNNEAELAGVLGHEIGHVAARHSARQYSKAQLAALGLGLGSVLSEDIARFANVAQTGLALLFLKFSRDHERESDRLGVEYSTKAGYDAREMANFFATLERMHPSPTGLPGWFTTHPSSAERVQNVRRLAEEWQAKMGRGGWTVNRDEYLDHIDGLIFGEDPRQGYVLEGVFYHPELRFQFVVPSGWTVQNSPSQVQIVSPDERAAILLSLSSQPTPAAAADEFVRQTKAVVVRAENDRVNGLPARMLVSDIAAQQGTLRVISYFIHYGGNIYVFHGLTGKLQFGNYLATFESSIRSFRRLNDPARIHVEPKRIRIRRVSRSMTLKQALKSLGVPDDQLEDLALLNGMELTDQITAGTRLKIVP